MKRKKESPCFQKTRKKHANEKRLSLLASCLATILATAIYDRQNNPKKNRIPLRISLFFGKKVPVLHMVM